MTMVLRMLRLRKSNGALAERRKERYALGTACPHSLRDETGISNLLRELSCTNGVRTFLLCSRCAVGLFLDRVLFLHCIRAIRTTLNQTQKPRPCGRGFWLMAKMQRAARPATRRIGFWYIIGPCCIGSFAAMRSPSDHAAENADDALELDAAGIGESVVFGRCFSTVWNFFRSVLDQLPSHQVLAGRSGAVDGEDLIVHLRQTADCAFRRQTVGIGGAGEGEEKERFGGEDRWGSDWRH